MELSKDKDMALDSFSEDVWVEVLKTVDQTYKELVEHQVELEKRNAELEGMRTFLTSVLGAMNDVLIVSGPEGQVLEVNDAFERTTGRRKRDVLGTLIQDLFDPSERDAIRRDFAALQAGQTVPHAERQARTAEGSTPLDLSITARMDSRGRLIGAVTLGRPVGELRRAYREMQQSHRALQEAQSQLVHSEKLASLGRLLAGVAHELNNPISFVYGNAHALERYTAKFEAYFKEVEDGASRAELVALRKELKLDRAVRQMRSAVSGALEGAERVRDIVESLRRLSADGTGQVEVFDLVETTRTAALWVIKGRASEVPVTFDTPDAVWVLGRPGHIQQVVMNLIQNAIDALSDTADPAIMVKARSADGRGILEVADNGPGIPEDVRLRVFDPFFTTKPVGKGTGLGLSISYKIVGENAGTLSVENNEGAGAVFRMTLPASDNTGGNAGGEERDGGV